MEKMNDFARSQNAGWMEAKLHQGYDPNSEFKEQGTLFSNVLFDKSEDSSLPLLTQLADFFSDVMTSVFGDGDSYTQNGNGIVPEQQTSFRMPDMIPNNGSNLDNASRGMSLVDDGSFGSEGFTSPVPNGGDRSGLTLGNTVGSGGVSQPSPSSSSNSITNNFPDDPDDGDDGMLDAPIVTTQPANGDEGDAIPLIINVSVDTTPGVVTSVTIFGVPVGATLSAGINNGNGTWTLTVPQLAGLTITPPPGFSGGLGLSVFAVSTLNGVSASSGQGLAITVEGVASDPTLSTQPASGDENSAIPLVINARLTDNDGSETLSIMISGVPTGAALSAGINNGGGVWTLTPAQLIGLTITPPPGSGNDFVLTVTATSSENGTTASVSQPLSVVVGAIASTPFLIVQNASGDEDTPIPLTINAALSDTDGSETLSIVIGNVPTGATLSAGINNGNGTWTLTPAQLVGLTITPPPGSDVDFTLTVTATSSENGTTASVTQNINVEVEGVANQPNLDVEDAVGLENIPIVLDIDASLVDNDGSETLSITISGVPTGAFLSAGINNGGGAWTLTPAQLVGLTLTPPLGSDADFQLTVTATSSENGSTSSISDTLNVVINGVADTPILNVGVSALGAEDTPIALTITAGLSDGDGSETLSIIIDGVPNGAVLSAGLYAGNGKWSLTVSDLVGLTLTPPENYSGNFVLVVSAIATETNGDTTQISANCTVTVTPVADVPNLVTIDVRGQEDQTITLDIQSSLNDLDGSEVLSVTISGVPIGANLSAGTNNGGGIWTLTPAQLTGLYLSTALNNANDFVLTVTATARESDNTIATHVDTINVIVDAIADVPTVFGTNTAGLVNTNVDVTIGGGVIDLDGSESVTFVVNGVPDGFALSAGLNNGDNTWTLTPAQLVGLTLIAPHDFEGRVYLTVNAVSHEAEGNTELSAPAAFNVGFGNAALGVQINLGIGLGVLGIGIGVGVGIGLNLGDLTDSDGITAMEGSTIQIADGPGLITVILGLVSYLSFSGVPLDASFNHGTNQGGGVWFMSTSDLNNLELTLGPNGSNDFILTFRAHLLTLVTLDLETTPVHVVGVADAPTLNIINTGGVEDASGIALNITAGLTDTDGSEQLSILIRDLPAGSRLSAGINNGNGTWSLTTAQLVGLMLHPPEDFSGTINYTVVATSTELEGDSSMVSATGQVVVTPVVDATIITATQLNGSEDQALNFGLGIALGDTDGSENLIAVTVSGLPAGASLTHAVDNGNGTWSVNVAQIGSVQFISPSGWHGDVNLNVTATTQESNGSTQNVNSSVGVHIEAVADTPTCNAIDASGFNDEPIDLFIGAALTDNDGSEHLSIVIGGVPIGAVLSAGNNNNDGTWTVSGNELTGLQMMPPTNFSGDIALTATSYSQEQSNGDTAASVAVNFNVHVDDPPAMMSMMMFSMDAFDGADAGAANDVFSADSSYSDHGAQDYGNTFNDQQSQLG